MFRFLFITILLFSTPFCFAQKCQIYRDDFIVSQLPIEVSEDINCTDSLGEKQGLWFYNKGFKDSVPYFEMNQYKVYFNEYAYGKYIDNRKVGEWATRKKVSHTKSYAEIDYIVENYFHTKDTIIYTRQSLYNPQSISLKVHYNADSTLIKSIIINPKVSDTVFINCDSRNKKLINNCKLYYQYKLISTFPDYKFEDEFYWAQDIFVREKYKRLLEINSK